MQCLPEDGDSAEWMRALRTCCCQTGEGGGCSGPPPSVCASITTIYSTIDELSVMAGRAPCTQYPISHVHGTGWVGEGGNYVCESVPTVFCSVKPHTHTHTHARTHTHTHTHDHTRPLQPRSLRNHRTRSWSAGSTELRLYRVMSCHCTSTR
jgi:hypothetical protein